MNHPNWGKMPLGVRVKGGSGEDYDTGTVAEPLGRDAHHPMAYGPNAFVAWDSGVKTWTPLADLSCIEGWGRNERS